MKTSSYITQSIVLSAALLTCGIAFAQDKACLLQGNFVIGGQRVVISDCAENKTMPKSEFREVCACMAEFTLAGETYRATVNFSASCPPDPQGSCEGIFGGAMTARYYKRDPKTLEDLRKTCLSQQGRWK